MYEILKQSRFIAIIVFLVLVFHLFVSFLTLDSRFLDERSCLMLETGVHLFAYILYLLYLRMLHRSIPESMPIHNVLTFGLVCYIALAVTELASLRLAGTDFDWNFALLKSPGEFISLAMYLLVYSALTVFYIILGLHLPRCAARVATFFVAASQLVILYVFEWLDYLIKFEQYTPHTSLVYVMDDIIFYGLMIWLLLAIPRIPFKKKFA